MPARRLRLVAPLLALLLALAAVAALAGVGRNVVRDADPAGSGAGWVEHGASVPGEAGAVVRRAADHLRAPAAPLGPVLAWSSAAAAASALVVSTVALVPVAVPCRSAALVRRRGPPSSR
jgi:hypothetical protein